MLEFLTSHIAVRLWAFGAAKAQQHAASSYLFRKKINPKCKESNSTNHDDLLYAFSAPAVDPDIE
jgi:hypothetical protein